MIAYNNEARFGKIPIPINVSTKTEFNSTPINLPL